MKKVTQNESTWQLFLASMDLGLRQQIWGHSEPEDACLKMFTDWLAGGHNRKPPTWDALIQSLRSANLPEIADLLKFNHIYLLKW